MLCVVSDAEAGGMEITIKLSTSFPVPVPAMDPVLNLPADLNL